MAPFEKWKGHYDLQLKSLIQLLCQFEIDDHRWWSGMSRVKVPSDPDHIRTVKVKLGWLPVGARIVATYVEQWKSTGTQNLHGSWEITAQNSVGDYTIEPKKDNTLQIKLKDGELELSQLGTSPRTDLVHMFKTTKSKYNRWHRDFEHLNVGIRLVLTLGKEEVSIPYKKNTFKEGEIVHNDNQGFEN